MIALPRKPVINYLPNRSAWVPARVKTTLSCSMVEFELASDGRVILVKADTKHPASRFQGLRGRAGQGLSTDQIMALTRGED
jgi:antitoxin PrlF